MSCVLISGVGCSAKMLSNAHSTQFVLTSPHSKHSTYYRNKDMLIVKWIDGRSAAYYSDVKVDGYIRQTRKIIEITLYGVIYETGDNNGVNTPAVSGSSVTGYEIAIDYPNFNPAVDEVYWKDETGCYLVEYAGRSTNDYSYLKKLMPRQKLTPPGPIGH